ncbi:MAG: winged helix-turn-helix domain-containing protein [Methanosarcinales archaeon]
MNAINSEVFQKEMNELKLKISELHQDVKKYFEKSNQELFEMLLKNSQYEIIGAISAYMLNNIENSLDQHMIKDCNMHETCRNIFINRLHDQINLLKSNQISESDINDKYEEFIELKNKAPYDKCDTCFKEVFSILNKQSNIIRSLRIYKSRDKSTEKIIGEIPEDIVVDTILTPIANHQRFQILKELYYESKTFSALSKITGLRGGNLLFHIQKLIDSGIILQRHGRGDYMITEKGHKLLNAISEIYWMLIKK